MKQIHKRIHEEGTKAIIIALLIAVAVVVVIGIGIVIHLYVEMLHQMRQNGMV